MNSGLALTYLFAIGFVSLTPRSAFELLLIALFIAFSIWYVFLKTKVNMPLLLATAILGRLIFFFGLPFLSDDFYRFIWDGELLLNGINPIGNIPTEVVAQIEAKSTLLQEMNSPEYPSVYPPLHQAGMAFGALFNGFLAQVNGMRIFIIFCELIGFLYFLRFAKASMPVYLLYLTNPLVVVEGVGNIHFEAALLPFLAIAIERLAKESKSYVPIAIAILIKLNPLILIPSIWNETGGRRVVLITGTLVLIGFLPFLGGLSDSLHGFDLFFRSFEFNASFYYLFSEIGKQIVGYNAIAILGPAMASLSAAGIIAIGYTRIEFKEKALMAYLIFLLFAATVHPWYIIPLVYLALLTRREAILIWSFTAFFSYSHYLDVLEPKYNWLLMEYVLLFAAIVYEYRRKPLQLFRG
jgi:hypothetical protein